MNRIHEAFRPDLLVRRQKALLPQRFRQIHAILFALPPRVGRSRAGWKEVEAFLQVDVASVPPGANSGQVVTARHGDREAWIPFRWNKSACLILFEEENTV